MYTVVTLPCLLPARKKYEESVTREAQARSTKQMVKAFHRVEASQSSAACCVRELSGWRDVRVAIEQGACSVQESVQQAVDAECKRVSSRAVDAFPGCIEHAAQSTKSQSAKSKIRSEQMVDAFHGCFQNAILDSVTMATAKLEGAHLALHTSYHVQYTFRLFTHTYSTIDSARFTVCT